jgi:hypothetical protein
MENVNFDFEDQSMGIYEKLSAESKDITPEIQEEINNIFGELFDRPILD